MSDAGAPSPLLKCRDLSCSFPVPGRRIDVLQHIDLQLGMRRSLGIVGESGAGKSMLVKAIMGIAPENLTIGGRIELEGVDLATLSKSQRRRLLGRRVGMVFQNPMTSLNPFVRVGRQIEEASRIYLGLSRRAAHDLAVSLLASVGIASAEDCYNRFPHQFSGGMKQRIMIATALACEPALLIADEATTALDVTIQKEVLDLLQTLQHRRQMSMILVTHNLGIVAGRTDEILVLYGGRIVEYGATEAVFERPRHRYTAALLSAMPRLDEPAHQRLRTIPGGPPDLARQGAGCPFAPRCVAAESICHAEMPRMSASADDSHRYACHFPIALPTGATPYSSAAGKAGQ